MKAKGCPYCGGKPLIVSSFEVYVVCTECGAKGPIVRVPGYTTKKHWELRKMWKAVTLWNKRYHEEFEIECEKIG